MCHFPEIDPFEDLIRLGRDPSTIYDASVPTNFGPHLLRGKQGFICSKTLLIRVRLSERSCRRRLFD